MSRIQKIAFWVSLSLLLIVGGFFVVYNQYFQAKNLINYCNCDSGSKIGEKDNSKETSAEGTKVPTRYSVSLNKKAIKSEKIKKNDILKINLCNNIKYQAKIDKVSQNVNGTTSISGQVLNNSQSYLLITSTGDKTLVDLEVPDKNQRFIIQSSSGQDYLTDRSGINSDELEDQPALSPPDNNPPVPKKNNPVNDSPVTINVMMVYTAAAREWADSYSTGIDNLIANAVAKAQLVNDNSNVGITFNLVHSVETDYEESGSSYTDLVKLSGERDGSMDNIHDLRDEYGADLVSLLANVNDTGGISWLLGSEDGDPAYAFSLARVQQTEWTYTWVHELGHNMGAGHSKEQNFQPGPGLFDYSAGWRWTDGDGDNYCSVMTYESGSYFTDHTSHTRVPYWSSPLVNYEGTATGDADDGDNARTLTETKTVVSEYLSAPLTTVNISIPSTTVTNTEPVSYILTYSGANSITLADTDITLNKTDTANGTVAVTGSGNVTRTVTISDITGSGTLGITVATETAENYDGVLESAGAGPSTTFTTGYSGPLVTLSSANYSNGWNMVSFPYLSGGITSATLLPSGDKLRQYDGNSNSYIRSEDGAITLASGAGYWLRTDDVNNLANRSYILNDTSSVEIPVTYGWNLLGNPYQANIPLSNLVVKYNNGSTQSFADAINSGKVYGYAWSWEKSINNYRFIAVYPDRYNAGSYPKSTYVYPYRGFWMLTKSRDVSSIILNR